VLLLTETLIAFAWMLYIGQKIFFGAPTPAAEAVGDPPLAMRITLIVLMIGALLAPVVGIPLARLIGG